MARLHFTPNLERHLGVRSIEVDADTLRGVLEAAFLQINAGRSYILDDQGHVRHHVAVFVDGVLVQERERLNHPILQSSEIWVMQALSGG